VVIAEAIDASFVTGFRVAMVIGAAMALLGAAAAWRLVEGMEAKPAPAPMPGSDLNARS
jgi:hypothetical protein